MVGNTTEIGKREAASKTISEGRNQKWGLFESLGGGGAIRGGSFTWVGVEVWGCCTVQQEVVKLRGTIIK